MLFSGVNGKGVGSASTFADGWATYISLGDKVFLKGKTGVYYQQTTVSAIPTYSPIWASEFPDLQFVSTLANPNHAIYTTWDVSGIRVHDRVITRESNSGTTQI